jgi:hypothetical protein
MAATENGAVSLSSTNDPRLNLFFKLVRDIDDKHLFPLLDQSFAEFPLDTMKILMNGRNCRGGKGDYRCFISALAHLDKTSPEWVQANIDILPEVGRYQDLVKLWHAASNHETRAQIMTYVADLLTKDKEQLTANGAEAKISLLAKWIPSEGYKLDGHRSFTRALCKKLFGGAAKSAQFKALRTEYLAPLRKHLNIIETNLVQKTYEKIEYSHVPSVAIKRYKKTLTKNDSERFTAYLDQVKAGKKKINAGQVYPHNLVHEYLCNYHPQPDPVLEEQWKVIEKDVRASGAFDNSLVICDVSGSMDGTPMEVAIALGILGKNRGRIMTFSDKPAIVTIPDGTLQAQVKAVQGIAWGYNTDFAKVMDLVIKLDDPIETIFVFSDMQFDEAFGNTTHFEGWKNKFRLNEKVMPKIVFWNLRGNTGDFPVSSNEHNVVMLSGYSPSLIKSVMTKTEITPLGIMLEILASAHARTPAPCRGTLRDGLYTT